jgi:hypothetical protein
MYQGLLFDTISIKRLRKKNTVSQGSSPVFFFTVLLFCIRGNYAHAGFFE